MKKQFLASLICHFVSAKRLVRDRSEFLKRYNLIYTSTILLSTSPSLVYCVFAIAGEAEIMFVLHTTDNNFLVTTHKTDRRGRDFETCYYCW